MSAILLAGAAHVIDARQPVDQVADDVIRACAINGHPIEQLG